jgi:hypothetical protein
MVLVMLEVVRVVEIVAVIEPDAAIVVELAVKTGSVGEG